MDIEYLCGNECYFSFIISIRNRSSVERADFNVTKEHLTLKLKMYEDPKVFGAGRIHNSAVAKHRKEPSPSDNQNGKRSKNGKR